VKKGSTANVAKLMRLIESEDAEFAAARLAVTFVSAFDVVAPTVPFIDVTVVTSVDELATTATFFVTV